MRRRLSYLWNVPFVRNVLTLQAGSVVVTLIGSVKFYVYLWILGVDMYGIYAVTQAFTGTFGIFTNFGQNQAALTFFAEHYTRDDRSGMAAVMRYYLQLALLACVLLVIFIVLTPWLTTVFGYDPSIGWIAQLAFAALIAGSFDTMFSIVLQTTRAIKVMTVMETANVTLQFVLGVWLLLITRSPAGIFAAMLIGNVFMLGVYVSIYARMRRSHNLPTLREVLRAKHSIRPYLGQGLWIAFDKNIGNLFPQSFFFVMSLYASPAVVGIANIAFKIANIPRTLLLPHIVRMSMTVLPAVEAKGKAVLRAACAKILKHSFLFHSLISFAALLGVPVIAWALAMLVHDWRILNALTPMLWMILIQIISGLNVVNAPLFRLLHKAYVPALWGVVALPVQLAFFAFLLQWMDAIGAFALALLFMYVTNLYLNGYLYFLLKRGEAR